MTTIKRIKNSNILMILFVIMVAATFFIDEFLYYAVVYPSAIIVLTGSCICDAIERMRNQ